MTRLTWLGHSTVLIEAGGHALVTDPMLRQRVAHLRRAASVDPALVAMIDTVLISHLHRDHLDIPSLRRLAGQPRLITPSGSRSLLRRRNFKDVVEVDVGGTVQRGDIKITALDADHDGRRSPVSTLTPSLGYMIDGPQRVYFAGDTDIFEGMAGPEFAGADVALLPISGWGPKTPPGHLNPERAAKSLQLLKPKVVVPIHWGTYAPINSKRASGGPEQEFAELAAELAPDVEVKILGVGESLEL